MIQPNELRIGNYIQREDLVSRELRFEQVLELCDKVTTTGPVKVVCDYNDIKPIPLTEQWLLDFGFEKPAHSFIGDVFHLSEWDEHPNNWCVAMNKNNAIIFKRLKHVHQLQNLYFALTGEELTIKEKL